MQVTIEKPRKDGKFPVKFKFDGFPNMFGGSTPARFFNKLYSLEQVQKLHVTTDINDINNFSGVDFK